MTTTISSLRVATRGSALALTQTKMVIASLTAAHPGLQCDIVTIKTTGDRDQRPFSEIGGKGLFTSEVERALIDGEADIAVHSAKDLTAELGSGCVLAAVPERAPVEDVVVGAGEGPGELRLASLRSGARIGTSSMRRRALLAEMRGDLEVIELRGNLDTRLRKVASGEVDAAILARAGIQRLGAEVDMGSLQPDRWVPPPGQGALAVEALGEREDILRLVAPIDHAPTRAEVECERAFGARLEGGCSVPLGCLASASDRSMVVTGFIGLTDGMNSIRDRISGPPKEATALGVELAEAILASGGAEILEELRFEEAPNLDAP